MKDALRKYLTEHSASQRSTRFNDDESLIEAGIIDSVTMIDLVAHLERTYKIRIAEEDMTPENFDSLSAIAAYLAPRI